MNQQTANKTDRDVGATLRALRRAAKRAKELGVRTGTPVYVIQDHRIVDLTKKKRVVDGKVLRQRQAR